MANPSGAQVAAGAATFRQNDTRLLVRNAPNTVINWRDFSIGAGERTRFIQDSASSAVLNRVVGNDASNILGKLSSNGRVFLINPHGIVFGAGATINTAGFIASTLNMSDSDFLQGKLRFEGGGAGALRNAGTIKAAGDIMLVGPSIENSGLIHSNTGSVLLAAGKAVTITSPDAHGVTFTVQAPTDSIVNLGTIEATKAVGLFAGTLRHSGDINVVNAGVDGAGRVLLAAQHDAVVQSGSTISAIGAKGGAITVESGGTTLVSGKVDARGSVTGGTIKLLGSKVGILDGADVNASGGSAGGKIYVGGDYRGLNPGIRNAVHSHIGADAAIRADATAAGDGGRIIVWSNDTTRVHGLISARGADGGRGGFVETSGKNYLEVTRLPALGAGGTWLLDPRNIEVVSTATTGNSGPTQFQPTADDSKVNAGDIATQLNAGVNVILDTNSGGGAQAGNITVNAAINKTGGPLATLTFNAQNDVTINQPITLTNGNFNVTTLNAGSVMDVGHTVTANAMTLNLAGNLTVAPVGSTSANLSASSGQTITAQSLFVSVMTGSATASIINSSGTQSITINSSGGTALAVQTDLGATGSASIVSNGGPQNITVNNSDAVQIIGRGGSASINANNGLQTVLIQGSASANQLTIGAADAVNNSQLFGFSQDITVGQAGQAGSITIVGGVTDNRVATISTGTTGATQSVSTTGTITATGGSAATGLAGHDAAVRHNGTGAQTVLAGHIILQGGSGAGEDNDALIFNANTAGGAQTITAGAGGINLTGGTAGNLSEAHITQGSLSAPQTITVNGGGSIVLQGGSSFGSDNQARIDALGPNQTINFTAGGTIDLTGGTNGTRNLARIRTTAPGSAQTITGVDGITLLGGASGGGFSGANTLGNFAQIRGEGTQSITVSAGGITMTGGGGTATDNFASISQADTGGAAQQTIVVDNGGTIALMGGSSAAQSSGLDSSGSFAFITASGGAGQSISFTGGGAINITGGTVGTGNSAGLRARTGPQSISGSPTIVMTAGASGGIAADTNSANIFADVGAQTIVAGPVTLVGASGGTGNSSTIRAQTQNITVNGDLTLTGNSGGSGSAGSRIGSLTNQPMDLTLTVNGELTLNGGSAANAGSAIGPSGSDTTAQVSNITVNATGNVFLNGGTGAGSRIGHPSDLIGGGDISVSAGGDLVFAAAGTTAGSIRTTGNVSLQADAAGGFISQAAGSAILANVLTASADSGVTLAGGNLVNSIDLGVATAGASLTFNSAQSLTISPASITTPAGAQTVAITTTGAASDLTVGGAFVNDDNVTLTAGRDILFSAGTSLTGGSVVFTGGGMAKFSGGAATLDGTATFTLPVNIAAGAVVNLAGAGAKTISTTTLTNAGTLNLAGTGNLILNHGSVLSNSGVFDIQSDADVQTLAGPASTIANSGLIVKSGGAGLSELGAGIPLTIQNASNGTIHVQSGTLQVNGGFPSNSGLIQIDAATTFSTNGSALTNTGTGTIRGAGTLDLAGNTLTNSGTVAPGGSPGTMVINGNFTQDSAGTLQIELGGTTRGVDYDLLQVNGVANLGGTLQVVQSGGYVAPVGQAYDFLAYVTHTGDFQTKPPGFQGTPGPTSYAVVATTPTSIEGIAGAEQGSEIRVASTNQVLVMSDASAEQAADGSSGDGDGGGTGGATRMSEAEADKAPRAAATECR